MRPQPFCFIAGSADGVERGAEIDGDNGIPFVRRKVLDPRHVLDAGVVHQDVDAAQLALGVGHEAGDLRGLAHVGGVVRDLDAGLAGDDVAQRIDRIAIAQPV
jgi:hypothetical protein